MRRHDARTGRDLRRFPPTDYSLHATAGTITSFEHERATAPRPSLRDFRKISADFLAAETPRDYIAETAVLALVAGIAAWPIISMLIVLAQTARG
jgi:hypothetical protein